MFATRVLRARKHSSAFDLLSRKKSFEMDWCENSKASSGDPSIAAERRSGDLEAAGLYQENRAGFPSGAHA